MCRHSKSLQIPQKMLQRKLVDLCLMCGMKQQHRPADRIVSHPSKAVLTHSESCQTTETNKHQLYLNRSPTAGHLLLAASAPDDER